MIVSVLLSVIGPVFVIIGAGYLVGRTIGLDRRALGRSVLYIFAPALALDSLTKATISNAELGQIVAFVFLATAILGAIVWAGARLAKMPTVRMDALLLSTLLMNAGNYGISASLFAFGQEGLQRAVVFFSISQIVMYTLGVFLASRGQETARQALMNILKLPVFWALFIGLVVRQMGWTLPELIAKPAALAGAAAVPVLLVSLGAEMGKVHGVRDWRGAGVASAIRLGLSIPVALVAGKLLGIVGVTLSVCVLQFAMPTAVTPLALALEFGSDAEFITGAIFVSTLASVVTLTLLLTFMH
ncbi:MAG: AEC family transporter [Anaerolineae bacterium]